MKWNLRIQGILDELCQRHPEMVANDAGPQVNDLTQKGSPRFELNRMFAEQVAHEFGGVYGLKRADRGRPISSESLAKTNGNTLISWSWENAHNGEWENYPESEDISDQVFVPVEPIDHLGADVDPNPNQEPDGEDGDDDNDESLDEFMKRATEHMEKTEKWQQELLDSLKDAGDKISDAIKNFRFRFGAKE